MQVSLMQVLLHFWAEWSEPCKHMDAVFSELAKECAGVAFMRVEAEEVDDVTTQYGVSSVPTFVFLQVRKHLDRQQTCYGSHACRTARSLTHWRGRTRPR